MRKINPLTIVMLLALIGFVALLAATRFGIGVYPDSVVYLDAARNLLHGSGLSVFSEVSIASKPLTHFPPLYSSVLALIGMTGVALPTAARWLNAALFGGNILIVGLMIRRFARCSFWLPVLGAFITLTAPDIAAAHSFALSEALFLFLTVIGLHWLAIYCDSQGRAVLISAALALGLSVLARYVGAASICAGTLIILSVNGRDKKAASTVQTESATTSLNLKNLRSRLINAIIFGAIACAPMGLWAVRNRLATGRPTDQPVGFHPMKLHHFIAAFSTAAQWLLLDKVRHDLRAIGFVVEMITLVFVTFYLIQKRRQLPKNPSEPHSGGASATLPSILALFIAFYLALMVFSLSFVDASIVFDPRHLLPVHLAALVLLLGLGWKLYVPLRNLRFARMLIIVPAMALAAFHGVRAARWFETTRQDGQGYASRAWRESPTIAQVKALPDDVTIYSNGFDAIYYLTGRRALYLPEKTGYVTGSANAKYELEIEKIREGLQASKGKLVYFATFPERSFLPSENELRTRLRLTPIGTAADGTIYELKTEVR